MHLSWPLICMALAVTDFVSIFVLLRMHTTYPKDGRRSMRITILALCFALVATTVSAAELTLFEHDGFHGRQMAVNSPISNLAATGFNDRASSVVVRGGVWQLC